MTPEQVSQSIAALPMTSLVMTLVLVYLALRSRWSSWKLAGALFIIFYGLYTLLGEIELLAFPAVSSQMPGGMIRGLPIAGLNLAVPISLLVVWTLGKTRQDTAENQLVARLRMPAFEWICKVVAGAILYVIVYFIFGYFVAWRTPGLPEFYDRTDPAHFWVNYPT